MERKERTKMLTMKLKSDRFSLWMKQLSILMDIRFEI